MYENMCDVVYSAQVTHVALNICKVLQVIFPNDTYQVPTVAVLGSGVVHHVPLAQVSSRLRSCDKL